MSLHELSPQLLGLTGDIWLCPLEASSLENLKGTPKGQSVGIAEVWMCRSGKRSFSLALPAALPWLNVSADGEDVHLVLDVSEEQHFGLSLYWNQVQGPTKPWWHRNLVRPPSSRSILTLG